MNGNNGDEESADADNQILKPHGKKFVGGSEKQPCQGDEIDILKNSSLDGSNKSSPDHHGLEVGDIDLRTDDEEDRREESEVAFTDNNKGEAVITEDDKDEETLITDDDKDVETLITDDDKDEETETLITDDDKDEEILATDDEKHAEMTVTDDAKDEDISITYDDKEEILATDDEKHEETTVTDEDILATDDEKHTETMVKDDEKLPETMVTDDEETDTRVDIILPSEPDDDDGKEGTSDEKDPLAEADNEAEKDIASGNISGDNSTLPEILSVEETGAEDENKIESKVEEVEKGQEKADEEKVQEKAVEEEKVEEQIVETAGEEKKVQEKTDEEEKAKVKTDEEEKAKDKTDNEEKVKEKTDEKERVKAKTDGHEEKPDKGEKVEDEENADEGEKNDNDGIVPMETEDVPVNKNTCDIRRFNDQKELQIESTTRNKLVLSEPENTDDVEIISDSDLDKHDESTEKSTETKKDSRDKARKKIDSDTDTESDIEIIEYPESKKGQADEAKKPKDDADDDGNDVASLDDQEEGKGARAEGSEEDEDDKPMIRMKSDIFDNDEDDDDDDHEGMDPEAIQSMMEVEMNEGAPTKQNKNWGDSPPKYRKPTYSKRIEEVPIMRRTPRRQAAVVASNTIKQITNLEEDDPEPAKKKKDDVEYISNLSTTYSRPSASSSGKGDSERHSGDKQRCHQCKLTAPSLIVVRQYGNDVHLCSNNCFNSFRNPDPTFRPLPCAKCGVLNRDNEITKLYFWETMNFCSDLCVGNFQLQIGYTCSTCSKKTPWSCMGKYCVRFGSDIRQFCTAGCLESYKKNARVCFHCQLDIKKLGNVVLANIPSKATPKEFCSQDCVEQYIDQNIATGTRTKAIQSVSCYICKIYRALYRELVTAIMSYKICSSACWERLLEIQLIRTPTKCETCTKFINMDSITISPSFYVATEKRAHGFCSATCKNVFVLKSRLIRSCTTCQVKKYNYDLIQFMDGKANAFAVCSLNCLPKPSNGILSLKNKLADPSYVPPAVITPTQIPRATAPLPTLTPVSTNVSHITIGDRGISGGEQIDQQIQLSLTDGTLLLNGDAISTYHYEITDPSEFSIFSEEDIIMGQYGETFDIQGASNRFLEAMDIGTNAYTESVQYSEVPLEDERWGECNTVVVIREPETKPMRNKACQVQPSKFVKETQTDSSELADMPRIEPKVRVLIVPVPVLIPFPVYSCHQPVPVPYPVGIPVPIPIPILTKKVETMAEVSFLSIPESSDVLESDVNNTNKEAIPAPESVDNNVMLSIPEIQVDEVMSPVPEIPIDEVMSPVAEIPIDEVLSPVPEIPIDEVLSPIPEIPIDEVMSPVREIPVYEVLNSVPEIHVNVLNSILEIPVDDVLNSVSEIQDDEVLNSVPEIHVDEVLNSVPEIHDDECLNSVPEIQVNILDSVTDIQVDDVLDFLPEDPICLSEDPVSISEDPISISENPIFLPGDPIDDILKSVLEAQIIDPVTESVPDKLIGDDTPEPILHTPGDTGATDDDVEMMDTTEAPEPENFPPTTTVSSSSIFTVGCSNSPMSVGSPSVVSSGTFFSSSSPAPGSPSLSGKGKASRAEYGLRAWKLFFGDEDPALLAPEVLSEKLVQWTLSGTKPKGDRYEPDVLLYFFLGIQQHLRVAGRSDQLFYETVYSPFLEAFTVYAESEMSKGLCIAKVEEDHVWDANELGPCPPGVLLFTLVYFIYKAFGLKTWEEHGALDFNQVQINERYSESGVKENYITIAGVTNADDELVEVAEEPETPHRCLVKLLEFYSTKCESKEGSFYRSIKPNPDPKSFWYSTEPLSQMDLYRMLVRAQMICFTAVDG